MAKATGKKEEAPVEQHTAPEETKSVKHEVNLEEGTIAKKGKPREPIPPGNYIGRCIRLIDIGTIDEDFQGKVNHVRKIMLTWELPAVMRQWKEGEEEMPATISNTYTLSTSPKANLRKTIEAWRGKALTEAEADAFDISNLLGKSCSIQINHKAGEGKNLGKIYEKVVAVTSLIKGTPVPDQINPTVLFNFTNKHFSAKFVETLPDFIKNKIKSSDEWKIKMAQAASAEAAHEAEVPKQAIADEEVPF